MIEKWLATLEQLDLLRPEAERDESAQFELSDEDIADTLWLAAQIGRNITTPTSKPTKADQEDKTTDSSSINTTDTLPPTVVPPTPTVPAYPQNTQPQTGENSEGLPDTGLPLDIQSAPALQNARGIGRALRPLMRKAPSRVMQVLDASATVEQIAEEEIWVPVLKPARERWFDLELVVENVPLGFVWEASLAEFQQVLERQGAFRHIRIWQVDASATGELELRAVSSLRGAMSSQLGAVSSQLRSPKELIDASKRGLVMYVSDCRSKLWHSWKIHKWLKLWGQHGPVTLVQLLPERLWQQTAQKAGFRVQVSAFSRGVANTQLRRFNVPLRYREIASSMLTLPAITLTEGAVAQWAQVVMAAGQQRLPARLFDKVWVENSVRLEDEDWGIIEPETPEDRLELFEATASAPAQRLARLMSVVPVELPVVHIIQRAFFRDKASPVHVAELYDSCLIRQLTRTDKREPTYDFEVGVRSLLNKQNLIDESFDVLDVVSQEIARSLGFEINSFTALLLPDIADSEQAEAAILPFAQIATDVLYRLGGQYAQLAVQVDSDVVERNRPTLPVEGEDFEIPPLRTFDFYRAAVREEAPPVQLVMDEFTIATVEIETLETEESLAERLEAIVSFEDPSARVAALIALAPQLVAAESDIIDQALVLAQSLNDQQGSLDVLSAFLPHLSEIWQERVLNLIAEFEQAQQYSLELVEFEFERASFVATKAGKDLLREVKAAYKYEEPLGDGLTLEMVSVPGGDFVMGSPAEEPERYDDEGPQHEVSVEPFFMGRYPITQAQWRFVAGLEQVNQELEADPSEFKGDDHPVESVSWYEAVEFCDRLSVHTGNKYELPTEAQWEYACRAGTTTPFHFGETISPELANYNHSVAYNDGPTGEQTRGTTDVDSFGIANAFGLSEMHGNVWEWCADHWRSDYEGTPADGSAWPTHHQSAKRVIRGGSWCDYPRYCRSATRNYDSPDDRNYNIGFRVCCRAPRTLQSPTS